jgi:hypothetical protein
MYDDSIRVVKVFGGAAFFRRAEGGSGKLTVACTGIFE